MLKQINPNGAVRSTARRVRLRASPTPNDLAGVGEGLFDSPACGVAGYQIFCGGFEIDWRRQAGHPRDEDPPRVPTWVAGGSGGWRITRTLGSTSVSAWPPPGSSTSGSWTSTPWR